MVYIYFLVAKGMKGNFNLDKKMVKEAIIMLMEINMMVNGLMI